MKNYITPFIQYEYPSFKGIANIEVENPTLRAFYKSFFSTIHLPEKTLKAFYEIITRKVN